MKSTLSSEWIQKINFHVSKNLWSISGKDLWICLRDDVKNDVESLFDVWAVQSVWLSSWTTCKMSWWTFWVQSCPIFHSVAKVAEFQCVLLVFFILFSSCTCFCLTPFLSRLIPIPFQHFNVQSKLWNKTQRTMYTSHTNYIYIHPNPFLWK